jgi:ABC-type phosphate transport system substrate-binding protein
MKKLIGIFVFVMLVACSTSYAQIAVIANKSVSESVAKGALANIYSLSMTKWASGTKIVVYDNNDGSVRGKFYAFIGKDALSLKKEWLKKQLTGEAKAPETLSSDEEVIHKVASTPGAIGYVKSDNIPKTVKVLLEIK